MICVQPGLDEGSRMPYQQLLNPANCALTLLDFQPAMFHGVQSHDRRTIVDNVQILARAAKIFGVPAVISTLARDSFSGPFMPEVAQQIYSDHPVIDRTAINSWLDPYFRKALEATGRKRIVLAGLWTSAAVTFAALALRGADYEVFFVADACGDTSHEAHERAVQRMLQAGCVPLTALQVVLELQQDWAQTLTRDPVLTILKEHTAYGVQVRFSEWSLGWQAIDDAQGGAE
jgi:nicotinamidase-related amidase